MRFRDQRWPCDHPVTLLHGDRGVRGRIVNISTSGARVALEGGEVGQGEKIVVNLTDAPVPGQVRWVRGNLAGLRFDRLLTPRETAVVRKTDTARQQRKGWNLHLHELG